MAGILKGRFCLKLADEHLHRVSTVFWVVKGENCRRMLVFAGHFESEDLLTDKANCLLGSRRYDCVLLILGQHPVQHCLHLLYFCFNLLTNSRFNYAFVPLRFYLLLIALNLFYSLSVNLRKLSCAAGKSWHFWNFDSCIITKIGECSGF